jgi:hypothetical protein
LEASASVTLASADSRWPPESQTSSWIHVECYDLFDGVERVVSTGALFQVEAKEKQAGLLLGSRPNMVITCPFGFYVKTV